MLSIEEGGGTGADRNDYAFVQGSLHGLAPVLWRSAPSRCHCSSRTESDPYTLGPHVRFLDPFDSGRCRVPLRARDTSFRVGTPGKGRVTPRVSTLEPTATVLQFRVSKTQGQTSCRRGRTTGRPRLSHSYLRVTGTRTRPVRTLREGRCLTPGVRRIMS